MKAHETIYTWIYSKSQKKEKLWKFLTRSKRKRGLRKSRGTGGSRIINRVSIDKRPDIAGKFGNWEGDLMAFQKNTQHILTLRERVSMLTLSVVLESKHSSVTASQIVGLLNNIPQEALKTLTIDNGLEFADHECVSKDLGIEVFFCDAYASWQKGGIENTNGRLRRDLPRSTDVKSMSKADFDETIENYNTTPRKSLGWRTPLQEIHENLGLVAL